MIRRHVPATTAAPDTGTGTTSTAPPSATRRRRKQSTAASRVSFYRSDTTRNAVRILLAGCFSAAFGIFCVLELWSVIDMLWSNTTTSTTTNKEGTTTRTRPFNPIYHAVDAHAIVGDRTDRYAALRYATDTDLLPDDPARSRRRVEQLADESYRGVPMTDNNSNRNNNTSIGTSTNEAYDIYHCPATLPTGYPYAWSIVDVLDHWPVDDTAPRSQIHQGLCVFDFETDRAKILTYRAAEVPFVVINDPAVAKTVERWNSPGYLDRLLMGNRRRYRTDYSENNHFMYFSSLGPPKNGKRPRLRFNSKVPVDWQAPTETQWMTYRDWLQHANVTADDPLSGPDHGHWYFRLTAQGVVDDKKNSNQGHSLQDKHESSEYLYDELPFFQPNEQSLYLVEPDTHWGINCRFGMKGVIAENHFDGSRNTVAVLGGRRRYILAHPSECDAMALYPMGHPSARHSAVDWSNPDLTEFPKFAQVQANEVVLQPGQVLYLPTQWFHFIVSLDLNVQCNTRSGIGPEYQDIIRHCGFM